MSKDKSGRPEAKSPDPPEILEDAATTEVIETPTAKPPVVPAPPPIVLGLARAVETKWNVPVWLTTLAAWTGSKFHTTAYGTNNACGILAEGTMQKNLEGYAWFGNIPIGYDQFGFMCSRLALDYTDKKACIAALKPRCPHIDTVSYTHFTEA